MLVCDPRAEDWEIKNCMFTLTVRIAHRMQIDLNIAEAKLPTWTRYATDTDNMRQVLTAAPSKRRKAEGHLDGSRRRDSDLL